MATDKDDLQGPRDSVDGSRGVQLWKDKNDNGGGTVTGTGQVTNGATGEVTHFTGDSGDAQHTFRLTNPNTGSPFAAHCAAACDYTGATIPGKPNVDKPGPQARTPRTPRRGPHRHRGAN